MGVDLTGKRFGYLTVIKLYNSNHLGKSWLCKCKCGNEIVLGTSRLLGSKSRNPDKSCGCKQKRQKGKTKKYPKLYFAWQNMIYRCYNPHRDNYERYGGSGITVCEEWLNSFESFLSWALGNGYQEHLTLDRIDSTKPYCPENCRWADYYTQEQNRGVQKRNKLGILGVCYSKYGFRAYISRDGERKHLGHFKILEDAIKARSDAEAHYEMYGVI